MMKKTIGFAVRCGLPPRSVVAIAAALGFASYAGGAPALASGALSAEPGAPTAEASPATASSQTVRYAFSRPDLAVAADGIADIRMAGLENFGGVGAPALPQLVARIAIPQGKTVASAAVAPLSAQQVASGVVLRHAERQVHPVAGVVYAPTPRDESIYSSSATYPASIGGEGRTAWKNGVAFYEIVLSPVFYRPATGDVGYYPEIAVTVEFANTARRAAAAPGAAAVAFTPTASRRAAVSELVDNPAVVAGYGSTTARRAAASGDGLSTLYTKPDLPCQSASYEHVVIAGNPLAEAAKSLVLYRRKSGVTSTMVTVSDILAAYPNGVDKAAKIRDFIKDAYANWGTEYVVLAGDTGLIPARGLYCETGGDFDELPSDLYYQCLDGDFDGNGNGVYGEIDDGVDGGVVDLYAEVKIGRVSSENELEFRNWFAKMAKYDADAADGAPYTRNALFVAEYLGPYENCQGRSLMEQIRLGTRFRGGDDGYETLGFCDVPGLFDADRFHTLYDSGTFDAWDGADVAAVVSGDDGVSVINHMGHSSPTSNMRLSLADIDALANENPFFVYSQGCDAGALDKDCVAEHFTTSSEGGAFAGVWNSRYGWYSYGSNGVVPSSASHRYHRRFWDAVFRDGHHELGYANMLSHERNAGYAKNDSYMRWCYYESNLFGDPIQKICGPENIVSLDREAYRSDATVNITYTSETATDAFEALVSLFGADGAQTGQFTITLPFAYETGIAGYAYTNSFDLAVLDAPGVSHGCSLTVSVIGEKSMGAEAGIDDVAPAFRAVSVFNADNGVVAASWATYDPFASNPDSGVFIPEDTAGELWIDSSAPFQDPTVAASGAVAPAHAVELPDIPFGAYFVRIVAVDKAGNTNVWNSAATSSEVAPADVSEYGTVLVTPRALRASWDMEKDTAGWTADEGGCWQLGVPTYGPYEASRCWGTVIDGRYPDGANASLVSPAIHLGANPMIEFRHWYSILATPDGGSSLAGADYGRIEVMAVSDDGRQGSGNDGVWIDATQFARTAIPGNLVQGASDGWEDVRICLPEDFAGKAIRIRFRFVSDNYPANLYAADHPAANVANPAGWYIDGVKFYDVPDAPGTIVDVRPVSDGALIVKPGSSVDFRIATFNVGSEPLAVQAGSARVSVTASGAAAGKVSLAGGSPASASYGTIPECDSALAAETFTLTVDPSVAPGTGITVEQTLTASDGRVLRGTALLRVSSPTYLSGVVRQPAYGSLPDPNPVAGATVRVQTSDAEFSCVTDADGAWFIDGLPSNRVVSVSAQYGMAFSETRTPVPAEDVALELPLSEFSLSADSYEASALATDSDIAVADFTIANDFSLASLDGNQGPSASLEYTVTGHLDADGNEPAWFHLANPEGSIAPGGSATLDITLSPSAANPAANNSLNLLVTSTGWNVAATNITVTLGVWDNIALQPAGATGTDTYGEIPVQEDGTELDFPGNDSDGALEKGEFGRLSFSIFNPSKYEQITSFSGEVTVASGDATIISDAGDPAYTNYPGGNIATWKSIAPESTSACLTPIAVLMGESDVIEFSVSGWARHGASSNLVELAFSYTNATRTAISGTVQSVNFYPATPVNAVKGVQFASVSATDAAGNKYYSNYTGTNGYYAITGLVPGESYWVSTAVPVGSTAVPPFGKLVTVSEGVLSETINCANYGELSGHLYLMGIDIDDSETGDGDGAIDNGETIRVVPRFANDGGYSVNGIRGALTVPDSFERAACMAVASGEVETGSNTVWQSGGIYALGDDASGFFEVTVDATAADGDFQRFLLEVWEETDAAEPKHWYFDFAIAVSPRYEISGTVTDADGNVVDGVALALSGDGVALSSEPDPETGAYSFKGLVAGDYTVSVSTIPDGYVANPASADAAVAGADATGLDFALEPWGVTPGGDGYATSADGTGSISLSVAEGETAAATFTLAADSPAAAGDVEVSIVYDRKASEILDREAVESGIAAARASLGAALGSDWTALDNSQFSDDEYEFVFKDGTTVAERDAFLARRGLAATYHFKTIPASIARRGATTAALATAALSNATAAFSGADDSGMLVSAQPSVKAIRPYAFQPDDTYYSMQWALSNDRQIGGTKGADIGAEAAWNYAGSTGSSNVIVAVTDTGIDYTHPDLAGNWYGLGANYVSYNEANGVEPGPDCSDNSGHGTHVAGIIGAVGGNGLGVVGANWSVNLMSQRISQNYGMFEAWASSAGIARSFEDAYLAGACVNNNSWGGPQYSDILYRTMKKAQDYGMLFVCAAGNEGKNLDVTPSYPASMAAWLDNVIVVSATDSDGEIASFSNYSPKLSHIAAPGVDILSTAISVSNGSAANAAALAGEGNYVFMSGTSMAAPYVSGVAAFLKSIVPNSSYGFIKDAILKSARVDPMLKSYVSTSGHLDMEMAARLLGAQWLRFGADSSGAAVVSTNVTLAAGASVSLPLLVNDPALLKAGTYSATIVVKGASSLSVPVTLTVSSGAMATLGTVEIAEEEAEDGLCAHGETVTLSIPVRNMGSLEFENLTATLSATSGGSVASGDWSYGFVAGQTTSAPGQFQVVLPDSGDTATFTLALFEDGAEVASLPVSVALFNGTVMAVTVKNASGAAVPGAEVELIGGGAGRGTTGADGVARVVAPAAATSACRLRVFADGYAPRTVSVDPSATATTVALTAASLAVDSQTVSLTAPEGLPATAEVSVSGASGVTVALAPRAKLAVFDDRDDSGFLVSRLESIGFDVDYFPSNYIVATYTYGGDETSEIIHAPRYTWDDANLIPYDAVIAVLSGANGTGRKVALSEQYAFEAFVRRGGRLVVTGTSVLGGPDNVELAALAGLSEDACAATNIASIAAIAASDGLGAPFVELSAGDAFPVSSGEYDASTDATFVSGAALASTEGLAKMYASERNAAGGQTVLWNGNASDWGHDGAAIDVLSGYLYSEFVEESIPEWLKVSATSLAIPSGKSAKLSLTANAGRALGVGTYDATLIVAANGSGERVAVKVGLSVVPPAIRAYTTGTVTDAGGRALKGDGSDGSCVFQLIYAGANGTPDAPGADGAPGGDDLVLAVSDTLLSFARFGTGAKPGSGAFDTAFNLNFDGYEGEDGGAITLYVRAWDGASYATSVAYGDSAPVTVTYTDGAPDGIDFGSWSLSSIVADPLQDGNGDGLPDAWTVEFRPDVDPQSPAPAIEAATLADPVNWFAVTAPPASAANAAGNPARVFATDKFVFVLETYTHRIAVHDRATGKVLSYYGANGTANNRETANAGSSYSASAKWAPGTGNGGFKRPEGMALDQFSGANRFAVADTENSRVQIFSFNPDTGDIAFVSSLGAESAVAGKALAKPRAVAFMKGNRLLVADTGNYRVVTVPVDESGNWSLGQARAFDFVSEVDVITGVAAGKDISDGFWVANAGPSRRRVSFHRTATFSPEDPVVSLGDASGSEFSPPRDVQVWTVGSRVRLVASDDGGSRVRVLDPVADDSGAYTGLVAVADLGAASDASLEVEQRLRRPYGVFPVDGENLIYVADNGNNRIKWYGLQLDADGDGMDDIWEDMNGLDSTTDDSQDDADGDGLSNIGEYLSGCDPQNTDSDGDGAGDFFEMVNGTEPLDDGEAPDAEPVGIVSIAAAPEEVEPGTDVAITVTFAGAVSGPGKFTLTDGDGVVRTAGELVFSGTTATATVDTSAFSAGAVSAKFTFAECDPPSTNVTALFTVTAASSEETYETVGWQIDSFTVAGNGSPVATVGWTVPTDSLPSDSTKALTFVLRYRSSLVDGDWDDTAVAANPIEVGQSEAGNAVEIDIDLSAEPFVSSPAGGFFTLQWTNKVAD